MALHDVVSRWVQIEQARQPVPCKPPARGSGLRGRAAQKVVAKPLIAFARRIRFHAGRPLRCGGQVPEFFFARMPFTSFSSVRRWKATPKWA